MKRLLLAAFLAMASFSLQAEQVVVRTGEHGSFTRLVFDLPPETSWSVENATDSVTVLLSAPVTDFDLSRAFDRIDRQRVADLRPGAERGSLAINLSCDCASEAFLTQDDMLVIDIAESSEAQIDVSQNEAEQVSALTLPPVFSSGRTARGAASAQGDLLPTVETILSPADVPANDSPIVDAIAEDLMARLQDASGAGLLASNTETDIVVPSDETETGTAITDISNGQPQGPVDLSARQLLSLNRVNDGDRISIGGNQCDPDDDLALETWAEGGVTDAIFVSRDTLYSEFDRLAPAMVSEQAKRLLHFGFGAEARALLHLDDHSADPVLFALTYLVDGSSDPSGRYVSQHLCPGRAVLWAALSQADIGLAPDLDAMAVIRHFDVLPQWLQPHLGLRLGTAFLQSGDGAAAAAILRRLERGTPNTSSDVAVLGARLDALLGHPEKAAKALNDVISKPGPANPGAVVAAMTLAETQETRPEDRLVELSGALSEERRAAPDGPELWRAHFQSLVMSDRFDAAATVLGDAEGVLEETLSESRNAFFLAVAERASDVAFLKHALGDDPATDGLSPMAIRAIASRLLVLGLPEPALDLLENARAASRDRDLRLLRAQALLDLSQPEQSEILLIGLQGEDVARMRAAARLAMGDSDYARDVFNILGETEDATLAAWLSGDWEGAANGPEADLSSVAGGLARLQESAVADAAPPLESATSLTQASADARNTLRAMLDATRIADDP